MLNKINIKDSIKVDFTPKQQLMRNLDWLYCHDKDKFLFVKRFMSAIKNKETILVEMSLNNKIYSITVRFRDYEYKEDFDNLEKAMVLVNMIKENKVSIA